MSDLIAWLRAQLDEDERVAREAAEETGPKWYVDVERDVRADNPTETPYVACGPWGGGIDASTAQHIARHDPARVLADIAAKRKILAHLATVTRSPWPITVPSEVVEDCNRLLRLLAQPYAGRDGWQEEWRA